MRRLGHSLRLATSAIQGRLPNAAEWPIVLEMANRGWLGPALFVALRRAGQLGAMPPDVCDYLALLHERNRDRNARLQAQLIEATRAFNQRNIEPILLKGAINLFTADEEDLGARMISDLDICVDPGETASARAALTDLGYRNLDDAPEMARPHDVGAIEFHDRPSAPSAPYLAGDLRASSPRAERDGAVARLPGATARALHLIVHDMIKEGDYWSLRIDLRHLNDLATLAQSSDGVDWQQLGAILSDPAARSALIVQARALEDLFGVRIPDALRADRKAELRHGARLVGANPGLLGSAVRLIGGLNFGRHRIAVGYAWPGGRKFARKVQLRLASSGKGSRL